MDGAEKESENISIESALRALKESHPDLFVNVKIYLHDWDIELGRKGFSRAIGSVSDPSEIGPWIMSVIEGESDGS